MSDFVILNGFDRSGTSAISRTISFHPDVEIIMQPFNSGFLRKRMYEVLDAQNKDDDAHIFFSDLQVNRLNTALIQSKWHYKFSTVLQHTPGKLHIIKTTINHMAQRWMIKYYPGIHVWGIWRDPFEIVSSIIKNGFYGKWYANALQEILPAVKREPVLRENYLRFFSLCKGEFREVALLVAIRTHFFLEYLDEDKLLRYDNFAMNATEAISHFSSTYSLKPFDFDKASRQDLNIIGKAYDPQARDNREVQDREILIDIFKPLLFLFEQKFEND